MKELLSYPNVVGYGMGHKWTKGVNTGKLCITVMVTEKVGEVELAPEDMIPLSRFESFEAAGDGEPISHVPKYTAFWGGWQ